MAHLSTATGFNHSVLQVNAWRIHWGDHILLIYIAIQILLNITRHVSFECFQVSVTASAHVCKILCLNLIQLGSPSGTSRERIFWKVWTGCSAVLLSNFRMDRDHNLERLERRKNNYFPLRDRWNWWIILSQWGFKSNSQSRRIPLSWPHVTYIP